MKEIRFAHVSDTHICKNYENTQIKDVYAGRENPTATLRRCLKKFEQDKLDFVLFTGDLVHEGKKEDYDYFLDTVRESMPNTKAIFVLGNHDRKQPFFESMGMEEREAYCYVEEIAGLRIVVLDSGVAGQETGRISETQEEWLEKILQEKKTEYGTILAFHHPIVWETPAFAMGVSDNLRRILRKYDVRALFCGHIHKNSVDFVEGIPQITADSVSYGSEMTDEEFQAVERIGYNICTFGKETWRLHVEQAQEQKVISSIDMKTMMKLLNLTAL